MAEGNGKTEQISLGSDLDAVVRYGGTTIELKADGNVTVKTNGKAVAYTNGNVKVRPPANDDGPSAALAAADPRPGDRMPDGTVYAGLSPDTGKAMYATANDAQLTYTFNHAQEYATKLDAHGHRNWRVPTKGELNVLFQNRAAIGGFDVSGSTPAGWYWSSSRFGVDIAWAQRFSDGQQYYHLDEFYASSLRCIR